MRDEINTELPSAYRIARGNNGRFYPLRFGKYRLDVAGNRISYGLYSEAFEHCQAEQREYERLYPAPGDKLR